MCRLEKLIRELCPNGVEYRKVGDVCNIGKGVQFNKRDMKDAGTFPVINGGINPSGYIEEFNQVENTITISQGGASAGFVNWITFKFWAGAHCYIVKPKEILSNRYLYHYLKGKEQELQKCQYGAGIPALSRGTVVSLVIPIPPLEVQQEIVRILDSFTSLIAELQAELQARRKQYEYYRENVILSSQIVQETTINQVCGVYDGTHQTPKYTDRGVKFVSVENIDNLYGSRKFISQEAYEKYKVKPQIGDVLMTRITAGIIGKCTVIDSEEPLAYYVSLALLRPDSKQLNSRYLKHYIESGYGKKQLRKFILTDATPPKINKDAIGKVKILLPPLEEQQRIVSILDRFDTLCNDLTSGLPAEIEARQKQYEYYRDKLLTFKEKA